MAKPKIVMFVVAVFKLRWLTLMERNKHAYVTSINQGRKSERSDS